MTDNGRYAHHPGRRAEDRLPARERPRWSDADVEQIAAKAARLVSEMRDSDPAGLTRVPNRAELAREAAAMRPHAQAWETLRTLFYIAAAAGALIAVLISAQGWVEHAITKEVAPIRGDVIAMQRDVRELLRRIPDKRRTDVERD